MSRTVYYAPGGGLGHVTRARRVLETLGSSDAVIVGSDRPFAAETAGGFEFLPIPGRLQGDVREHGDWISGVRHSSHATRLIVDTFPAGIQGELAAADLLDLQIDYVARLLRWDEYVAAAGEEAIPFDTAYMLEPLFPDHEQFVRANSARVESLDLTPALRRESPKSPAAVRGYWLVSHSGPEDEVAELVTFAQQLRDIEELEIEIVVATRNAPRELPPGCSVAHSAVPLYAGADRIISGCGFNTMLETEAFREKHILHPQPRRFDDQFERAARRRRAVGSRASRSRGSAPTHD